MPFTAAELAEMAAADAEIEATFFLTQEERDFGNLLDLDMVSPKIRKDRERSKAYYCANRERIIKRSMQWYSEHREQALEGQRRRYQMNREDFIARQKERRIANRRELRETQRKIKYFRKSMGMTQKELADLIGAAVSTISSWENGDCPAKWDKLTSVFPEFDAI